jgi:hypothetical protein
VLVICEELLPSKAGDSGGFFRLESHHEYLRTLISSNTQLHRPIQPPIIYQPCMCSSYGLRPLEVPLGFGLLSDPQRLDTPRERPP